MGMVRTCADIGVLRHLQVCATLLESLYCWGAATGRLAHAATLGEAPATHLLWAVAMTHLREPHDYLRHRLLHPWRKDWLPGPDPVSRVNPFLLNTSPGPLPVQAHTQAPPQELQHHGLLRHELPPRGEHDLPLCWFPGCSVRGPSGTYLKMLCMFLPVQVIPLARAGYLLCRTTGGRRPSAI